MTYKQPIFNLEIMKLATYYKQKKEIVKFATVLEPQRYSKFFVRKDYDDGNYPKEFFLSNVIYGGRAFSEQYIPLDLKIEKTVPDTSLYQGFKRPKFKDEPGYNVMLHGAHARLSLDGKDIWEDMEVPIIQKSNINSIIIHDYNIGELNEGFEATKQAMKCAQHGARHIFLGVKFPINIYSLNELDKWLSLPTLKNYFWLRYFGVMSDEVFKDFIKATPATHANLEYYVTYGCFDENDFVVNRLPIIFNQVLNSQMNDSLILLKYEDDFFKDKRWERLIDYFNFYSRSRADKVSKTFFKFLKDVFKFPRNKPKGFNILEARELFQFVREKNYEVFKMFYEQRGEKLND